MSTLFLIQCTCSAAVLAASFVGVRPVVMAAALPTVIGTAWVLA